MYEQDALGKIISLEDELKYEDDMIQNAAKDAFIDLSKLSRQELMSRIQNSPDIDIEQPDTKIITDYRDFLPIDSLGEEGDLLINLSKDEHHGELLLSQGLIVIAPNIIAHLDDLIKGVETNLYPVDDDIVYYPFSWLIRDLTAKGKYHYLPDVHGGFTLTHRK